MEPLKIVFLIVFSLLLLTLVSVIKSSTYTPLQNFLFSYRFKHQSKTKYINFCNYHLKNKIIQLPNDLVFIAFSDCVLENFTIIGNGNIPTVVFINTKTKNLELKNVDLVFK